MSFSYCFFLTKVSFYLYECFFLFLFLFCYSTFFFEIDFDMMPVLAEALDRVALSEDFLLSRGELGSSVAFYFLFYGLKSVVLLEIEGDPERG